MFKLKFILTSILIVLSGNAFSHGLVHVCSYEYAEVMNELRDRYGEREVLRLVVI